MTHPHITLTIDQARFIRTAVDDAIQQMKGDAVNMNCEPNVETLEQASKLLAVELECLRYL